MTAEGTVGAPTCFLNIFFAVTAQTHNYFVIVVSQSNANVTCKCDT
jgi:hypothetical protein